MMFGNEKKKKVHTPLLLQMEASECGAASLGIVLGYYGKYLPLEELRQLCNITRDGSSAQNILLAAEQLHMEGLGYSYEPEEVLKLTPPVILHWDFNHFLVYEGYNEETKDIYLNDPALGHRKVKWEDFEGSFTGVLLVLRPGEGFEKSGKPVTVWSDLLEELLSFKRAFLYILCIGVGMALVNLYTPILSQMFFDEVISLKHRNWLFEINMGICIAIVLRFAMELMRGWCLIRWQGSLTMGNSVDFLRHVLHLPEEFFKQRYAAEIASRVQFNETVASFVTGSMATVLLDAGVALFYLLLMFIYDVQLTLLGIFFTAVNCGVTWYVFHWLKEQQIIIQQEMGKVYGLSAAGIASMESLKSGGNERDFFVQWANANAHYLTVTQDREYVSIILNSIPAILAGISSALVMLFGGLQIMNGFMTIGVFVAFQNLMSNFQQPVQRLVGISQGIQETEAEMMKLRDVLNYPREKEIERGENIPRRLSGELELKKVSFGYGRIGRPLIKRLNVHVPRGGRVAIVGASGSGKSTAARLATGLYLPWSGQVLYDGIPLEEISREVFANSVAVVEQESTVFEGTIAENISLFDHSMGRDVIIEAAKAAGIHEDILGLNGGYEARVAEGGQNLSGGQCQRLALARAFAQDPALLILDEATSAIDPVTEKLIMRNIRRRGCSCLIIAHRLSTIRDCDEIIVLERGKVVERGNHSELVAKGGYYCALMRDNG